jgi:hypothetical protein
MITTAIHQPWELDVSISELSLTGLNVASLVRMNALEGGHQICGVECFSP